MARRVYLRVCLFLFCFLLLSVFAFGEEPASPASQPQEQNKDKVEISPQFLEETIPAYKLTLKQLIDLAEKYLKKVDREIEAVERSKKKETEVRERFDKANLLYQQGKLAEAQQEWRSVLSLTDNPEMKFYIGWLDKASGEIAKRKEEEEKLKRDERENLRLEAEKKCEEEIALRELERKLKEAKPQVKEEPKKETRIEAPQKNIEKTQSSSTQKREREINLELLRLQRSGN